MLDFQSSVFSFETLDDMQQCLYKKGKLKTDLISAFTCGNVLFTHKIYYLFYNTNL